MKKRRNDKLGNLQHSNTLSILIHLELQTEKPIKIIPPT